MVEQRLLISRSCAYTVLIIYVLDLDPVPPHMRTWGGLVSTFTLPETIRLCTSFLTLLSGLLGILDLRHACTTAREYGFIGHGAGLHSQRNDPDCVLRVRDLQRGHHSHRQDGRSV